MGFEFRLPARARFASDPARSRGRLHDEPASTHRSPFERDRDRIIHTTAFRRLKQKTQVFIAHEGDHYRTRLTHSLEVAQIARSLSRRLGLDEDLAEALALAHDLGHPPFGHAGEDELDACMANHDGFDHNAQTLRLLTKLEARYPDFDGVNLTWETLEGVIKHNGPLIRPGRTLADLPAAFRAYEAIQSLELDTFAGPEAQVAALADDIAYNNHDIDDGLSAGLFTEADLADLPLVGPIFHGVRADYPDISDTRIKAEAIRRLIGHWVNDLLLETGQRIERFSPKSVEDVRGLGQPLVAFSDELMASQLEIRRFLHERMYKHYRVNRIRAQSKRVLRDLFTLFLDAPDTLPPEWRERAERAGDQHRRARIVCDYVAGMTDAYAMDEHRKLFSLDRWD
jgi:dGTPase